MLEINPVLAGTFDAPNYAAANNLATTTSTDSTSSSPDIDSRRYTKFDRSATEAGSADLSFSDFLDMVNPLQHIPAVSSLYRAVTGETINPVSRVVGDILYGGAVGAASAVIGGLSAIGNSVIEAQTGQDVTGNIMTALLGPSSTPATTQLAEDTSTQTQTMTVTTAALDTLQTTQIAQQNTHTQPQVSAVTTMAAAMPQMTQAPASLPKMSPALTTATAFPTASTTTVGTLPTTKSFPLDRSKLPYGGVMDMGNNISAQNMAIALAESSHTMQLGNTIYTGRFMTGAHPSPMATTTPVTPNTSSTTTLTTSNTSTTTATTAAATDANSTTASNNPSPLASTANNDAKTGPQKNPLPQSLIDDMMMLKGLNQYKGVAAGQSLSTGSILNTTN